MRFEVPQFIEIEDKIIGQFTWRQFVYLLGGGGVAVILLLKTHIIIFILVGLPVAGLAGLLAFYPINNQPFSVFLESIITFLRKSTLYLWKKDEKSVYRGESSIPKNTLVENRAKGLTSLSRKLELESLKKER